MTSISERYDYRADTPTWPRLTKQDLRANPERFRDAIRRRPGLNPKASEQAEQTHCEHDYGLFDSCPGCDMVQEKLEDDATQPMRRVYFEIVAHGAAHLVPQRPPKQTVVALRKLGLLDWYELPLTDAHPVMVWRGMRHTTAQWTAVPTGHTLFTDGYLPITFPDD